MDAIINVFSMQGYGAYVWSSVAITLLILGGNAAYAYYAFRKLQMSEKQ